MFFQCAELLGFEHQCNFWGNARHYSNTQTFTLRGKIYGDRTQESIAGVWAGMSGYISFTSGNTRNLMVNSVDLGPGRLLSLDFGANTDVRYKEYTAVVEVFRHAGSGMYGNSGSINDTGTYFRSAGDNFINYFTSATGKYITDFSFSQSSELLANNKYSYSKDCSFQLDQGVYDEFGVSPDTYAQNLIGAAQRSYGYAYLISPEYPAFYQNGSGITYGSQAFDTINSRYSMSERFDFQSGLPYIWNYNHSFALNDSLVSVTENGSIVSTQISGDKSAQANTAWRYIEPGIFARVSGVYEQYTGYIGYAGGCGLFNQPEETSTSKDFCKGSIEYSRTYSNSPFNQTGYFYSYSDEISLDGDGYMTVSENGQLKAFKNSRPSGFGVVLTGYRSKSGEILSRISGLYRDSTGIMRECSLSSGLYFESSQETYKEYDAQIDYTLSYSENPSFYQDGLFYNVKSSTSNELPVHMVNYFPVAYDHIIAQRARQSTRGVFSNQVSLIGKETTTLNQLITGALARVQKPTGTDIYASRYSYNHDPFTNSLSLTLDYNYTLYRGPDDVLI